MTRIDLLNDTLEGEIPFSVQFRIEHDLASQTELEVSVDGVYVDTVVVGPESTEVFSYTFDEPGQHILNFVQTVGGGAGPIDIGYSFWAVEERTPDLPPGTPIILSARMHLVRFFGDDPDDGGEMMVVDLPADSVVGPYEAAALLLPAYEAKDFSFSSIEVTERSTSNDDPRTQ